jgi:hypothetical protein
MLGKGWEDACFVENGESTTQSFSIGGDSEFGVIPRCVADMFTWIDNHNGDSFDFLISMSY